MITVRTASQADYDAVAKFLIAADASYKRSLDELHAEDKRRAEHCSCQRFVVQGDESHIIAYAHYTQYADLYQNGKFWLTVDVHPDQRRQGIGTQLVQHMLDVLAQVGAKTLIGTTYLSNQPALAFAETLGFEEYSRRVAYVCDVASVDFDAIAAPQICENITIKSIADLADDPNRDEKIYTLQYEVEADIPIADPVTPITMAEWQATYTDDPFFLPDGSFIALYDNQYVGLVLASKSADKKIYIDLTGVHKDSRRQGVAAALKYHSLQYARTQGYEQISTTNDEVNTGMRAINERFGFYISQRIIKLRKLL